MDGRATCTYPTRAQIGQFYTSSSSEFNKCNNTMCNLEGRPFAQLQAGVLNPQAYKTAIDFTSCGGDSTGLLSSRSRERTPYDSSRTQTTRDARLFDMPRTQRFGLDTAPADSSVYMDNVYDSSLVPPSYNKPYTGYNDITPGDIRYYVDPDVAPAFRGQIYNMDGITRIDMFTTPMDKVEPMFYLQPVQSTHNNMSKDTFCRDQLTFRNDIISLQQRGHNKTRYEALK
jgi:hypothetical protein